MKILFTYHINKKPHSKVETNLSVVTGATQYFNKIQKNSSSEQFFESFIESTFRLGCSHHQDNLSVGGQKVAVHTNIH